MTRIVKQPALPKSRKKMPGYWLLQDAKAHFSELVRKAHSEGPQHVTLHGRESVVVLSVEEFARLKGGRSGTDLIAAMQALPYPDLDFETARAASPVRDVDL